MTAMSAISSTTSVGLTAASNMSRASTFSHGVYNKLPESLRKLYTLITQAIVDRSIFKEVENEINTLVRLTPKLCEGPSASYLTADKELQRRLKLIKDRISKENNPDLTEECHCLIAMTLKLMDMHGSKPFDLFFDRPSRENYSIVDRRATPQELKFFRAVEGEKDEEALKKLLSSKKNPNVFPGDIVGEWKPLENVISKVLENSIQMFSDIVGSGHDVGLSFQECIARKENSKISLIGRVARLNNLSAVNQLLRIGCAVWERDLCAIVRSEFYSNQSAQTLDQKLELSRRLIPLAFIRYPSKLFSSWEKYLQDEEIISHRRKDSRRETIKAINGAPYSILRAYIGAGHPIPSDPKGFPTSYSRFIKPLIYFGQVRTQSGSENDEVTRALAIRDKVFSIHFEKWPLLISHLMSIKPFIKSTAEIVSDYYTRSVDDLSSDERIRLYDFCLEEEPKDECNGAIELA